MAGTSPAIAVAAFNCSSLDAYVLSNGHTALGQTQYCFGGALVPAAGAAGGAPICADMGIGCDRIPTRQL